MSTLSWGDIFANEALALAYAEVQSPTPKAGVININAAIAALFKPSLGLAGAE